MELEIVNSIRDVDPSEWNSLVRASDDTVFQSHQWLRAYEDGHPKVEPHHVLIYEDSALVAACPIYPERRDEWLAEFGDIPPALLSHSCQAWYSNVLGRQDEAVTAIVLDTLEGLGAECGVDAVGFSAIPESETELMDALKSDGYTVVQFNCSMVLDVPESVEAYMDSLDGSHRRDFRRRVRRAREKGVTAEVVDDVDFERFQELCYEVFEKHDDYERRYSPEFLEAIRTQLDEEVSYLVIRSPEGEIISAYLMLEYGENIYPWIAGIDYDYLDPYDPSIFFYYAVVEYAIEQGFSTIDIGRGVIDFKRKFGYEPWLTYLALKGQEVDLRLDEAFPTAEIEGGQEVRSCC